MPMKILREYLTYFHDAYGSREVSQSTSGLNQLRGVGEEEVMLHSIIFKQENGAINIQSLTFSKHFLSNTNIEKLAQTLHELIFICRRVFHIDS